VWPILGVSAMKGPKKYAKLLKEVFHPPCSLVKILRICGERTGTRKKFTGLLFAD
jgi:hypothetical protein